MVACSWRRQENRDEKGSTDHEKQSFPLDYSHHICRRRPGAFGMWRNSWQRSWRTESRYRRRATLSRLLSGRSEEHTSELQSLMRISYAVFCLKKKNRNTNDNSDSEQK